VEDDEKSYEGEKVSLLFVAYFHVVALLIILVCQFVCPHCGMNFPNNFKCVKHVGNCKPKKKKPSEGAVRLPSPTASSRFDGFSISLWNYLLVGQGEPSRDRAITLMKRRRLSELQRKLKRKLLHLPPKPRRSVVPTKVMKAKLV